MRGAKVELLATCISRSTGKTITNAFMVVPESPFAGATPTLEQVLDHLKTLSDAERPARFIYHNKYSTSSYFLPSLFFRARRVFGLDDRASNPAGVTTIAVERNGSPSSSDLIRAVANQAGRRETIASVWNGPRSGFADSTSKQYQEFGKKVRFVQLPDDLPCDLLVATRKVDDEDQGRHHREVGDAATDRPGHCRVGCPHLGAMVQRGSRRRSPGALRTPSPGRVVHADGRGRRATQPVVARRRGPARRGAPGDSAVGNRARRPEPVLRLLQEERHPLGTGAHSRWRRPSHGAVRELPPGQRGSDAAVRRQFPGAFRSHSPSGVDHSLAAAPDSTRLALQRHRADGVAGCGLRHRHAGSVPGNPVVRAAAERLSARRRVARRERREGGDVRNTAGHGRIPETCRQPEPGLRTDGTAGVPRVAHARDARADLVPGAHHRVRGVAGRRSRRPGMGCVALAVASARHAPGATADERRRAPSPWRLTRPATGEVVLTGR